MCDHNARLKKSLYEETLQTKLLCTILTLEANYKWLLIALQFRESLASEHLHAICVYREPSYNLTFIQSNIFYYWWCLNSWDPTKSWLDQKQCGRSSVGRWLRIASMTSLNFIHCYFCKFKISTINIYGNNDTILGWQFIQGFKIQNLHSRFVIIKARNPILTSVSKKNWDKAQQ